jgi:uncharacterized protein (DUF983 family)
MPMTELKIQVNKREITVHCPACGKTQFFKPKSFEIMWREWNRCKNCNLDIVIEDDNKIKMVMEEVFIND